MVLPPHVRDSLWVTEASYIVYKALVGVIPYIFAKNGTTGVIDFSGTDFSTVFQSAVTATPPYGKVVLREDEYTATQQIILRSDIILDLGKAIINWGVGLPTGLFYLAGSLGETENLTVNASAGDVTLTVVDASTFAVGNYVLVHSDQNYGSVYDDGEIHKVKSVNIGLNQITIHEGLFITYTLIDNGRVTKLNHYENVAIYGGCIVGPGATLSAEHHAFVFYYVMESKIIGTRVENISDKAIHLANCVDWALSGLYIYGTARTGTGYGIVISAASSYIDINHSQLIYCRHCIAGGSAPDWAGQPRAVTVSNVIAKDSISAAFEVHETIRADHWSYEYCVFNTPGINAIYCGAINFKVSNCIFIQCSIAVSDRGNNVKTIIATDNYIYKTKYGVYLDSTSLDKVDIDGLYVINSIEEYTILVNGGGNDRVNINISNVHDTLPTLNYNKIYVYNNPNYVHIKKCIIGRAKRNGVYLVGVKGGIISDNDIFNNNQQKSTADLYKNAVYLLDCENLLITDNRIYDDQLVPTQRTGIQEAGTSDNNIIKNNRFYGNIVQCVQIIGANTILDQRSFQFTEPIVGVTSITSPTGVDVDAATEGALAWGQLPAESQQVVRIKVWAVATGTPIGAGGQMRLAATFNAGAANAAYNTATKSWTLANFDGEDADYIVDDVVHWVIEDADVGTELLNLVAGDSFEFFALYNAGADPDGATDAVFRCIEIEYV